MSVSVSTATKMTDNTVSTATKSVTNKSQELGKDDFLQLLLAQMKYQDPMNPASNTESIAQMAQFSSLEKMENLNTTLQSFGAYQQSLNSLSGANLIGKDITFSEVQKVKTKDPTTGNDVEKETPVSVSGTISSVSYADGEASFKVIDGDGKEHTTTFAKISNIKDANASSYTKNTKVNSVISGAAMIGKTIEGTYTKQTTDNYDKVTETEEKIKGTVKSVSFSGDTPILTIIGEDQKEYKVNMDKVSNVV